MPASSNKGPVVPSSDRDKASKTPQGPRVFKGGMVPQEALEASKPSSPPEVSFNPVEKREVSVQRMPGAGALPSPLPAAPQPSSPKAAVVGFPEYSGWELLGLEMDGAENPSSQWEIRKHPVTGEVVKVPVGKAAEAGATPISGDASLPPEAGFRAPSPAPASAAAAAPAAPTTPTNTTILDQA